MVVLFPTDFRSILCITLLTKAKAAISDVDTVIIIYGSCTYVLVLHRSSVVNSPESQN